jgi:RimJ/RimL family protein N-acetyltransferase
MVDYLFLSQNIFRLQVKTDVRNKASQRVLEKAGFKVKGTIRKSLFARGVQRWASEEDKMSIDMVRNNLRRF